MAIPFSQSLRSLELDSASRSITAITVTSVFLGAWLAWFLFAEITLHEVADSARIEAAEAAKPLNAAVGGRIVSTRLVLGKTVRAGDVLVELDSETEQRELAEERTRAAAVEPEIEALRGQLLAEQRALPSDREAMLAAVDEGRAKQDEASIDARLAKDEAKRAKGLHESGVIADVELFRARSGAQRKQRSTDALRHNVRRLLGEMHTRENQALAHVAQLQLQMAELEGKRLTSLATVQVLEAQIAKRVLRAPVDGTIGEVAPEHQIGSFVQAQDRLGALIPKGSLVVVAEFAPEDALGRVRAGQAARMRVEGFPWAQYGTLPVAVRNVASEAHNGRIRVELGLAPQGNARILSEHGLPGSVEVDVETSSPLLIALRYAGNRLGAASRPGSGSGS